MRTEIGAEDFKQLIGRFATGVAIVTVRDGEGRNHGMTASSIASVSLDPPLISVCVERTTEFHAFMQDAETFGISILAAEQRHISEHFAAAGVDRFANITLVARGDGADGPTFIDGAVAHLECSVWNSFEAGDHTVFLGLVLAGVARDGKPLLHYLGEYTSID
ncbi:MAG: flavin reductase family protein [Gemmatimonadales bacterium]